MHVLAVKTLRSHGDIAQAVEVSKYRPAAMPTDPLIGTAGAGPVLGQAAQDPSTLLNLQWYLFRCQIDQAWKQATGSGVVIADVDAGFYLQHQDLVANVEAEHSYNAVDGSADVTTLGIRHTEREFWDLLEPPVTHSELQGSRMTLAYGPYRRTQERRNCRATPSPTPSPGLSVTIPETGA